jgi:hypothetical protein
MKIKFTFVLITISIILLSATSIFTIKNGLHKYKYTLADGESLELDPIVNPPRTPFYASLIEPGKEPNKDDLINEKSFPSLNSAIIRAFETDSNNIYDLITYTNSISANRNVGYWSIIPDARISDPTYAFFDKEGYVWRKIEGFSNYYHRLFKSKAARTILFNQALDIVVSLCKSYPSDFKNSVLKELEQLLIFTNSLQTISASTDTDDLNDYWKGFIFRRYQLDNVPITEIQTSIINAQTKIKAIDVSKRPDAMYEININDQVTFYYSSEKYVLYSKSSAKEIPFTYETTVQKIKFLKDNTGDYYQLTGTNNSASFTYLYDKNLMKIE